MTAETTTTGDIHFDPYDHDLVVDPYPMYRRMRDEMPLYHNEEFDFYAVTRFDDVSRVLNDNATFISSKGNILELIQQGWEMPSGTVIFEDQPVHTRHRKLLSRLFTPNRMAQLEPKIREFCVNVLDAHVGAERLDIVADLGAQIPMKAIGLLLGIPETDQEAMRDTVDAALRTEAGEQMTHEQLLVDSDAFGHFVDARAANPSDDVISQLLAAEYKDDDGNTHRLTRDEIVTYTTVLAGAGNETTGRLLGWAGKIWGDHQEARHRLAADPSLIPNAVEEILRLEPPGPFIARYVTRDVEFHGRTVPAGSVILVIVAAANRDERRYENPDSYDIDRKDIQHMTFGGGIHYCMGNALARLEGIVALEELLKRFPDWEVDDEAATLSPTSSVRGYESLPVRII